METNEILQRFLPNYQEEWIAAMVEAPAHYDHTQKNLWACHKLMPKALQNLADKFGAQQRENCAKQYLARVDDYEPSLYEEIKDISEQPKIEEL